MTVYNKNETTGTGFYYWDNNRWVKFETAPQAGWLTTGNEGTISSSDFLGTIDSVTLNIRTNDTVRVTILPDGKVGIGTQIPRGKLHVFSEDGHDAVFSMGSNIANEDMDLDIYRYRGNFSAPSIVQNGDRIGGIRYNALSGRSGGVLAPFTTFAEISAEADGAVSPLSSPGKLIFFTAQQGTNTLSARMTIKNDGNIGIGTGSPTEKLEVAGTVKASKFQQVSDSRFKSNVTALTARKIEMLKPVSYYWNEKGKSRGGDDRLQFGFIAQDVEKVYPNLVKTDKQGYKSVDYVSLIPILTKEIQDVKKENKMLKAELKAIKELFKELKK